MIVHSTVHILKLLKTAKNENIKLRRSFIKEINLLFAEQIKKLKSLLYS
jgi:hypothetical protein